MTRGAATSGRTEIAGQALRYGVAGVVLAALYSTVYALLATRGGLAPQRANAVAFAVNLVAGWWLHSCWSFRGHGLPGRRRVAQARFVAVNLAGYALNCLWVWLIVTRWGKPVAWSLPPIVTLTPAFNFAINRLLVFRVKL